MSVEYMRAAWRNADNAQAKACRILLAKLMTSDGNTSLQLIVCLPEYLRIYSNILLGKLLVINLNI